MSNDKDLHEGDVQVLQEVVFNERLVTHPKIGQVRLKMPTLEIQRKIEAVARSKKKWLKEAKDTVTEEDGTIRTVPAFRSREQLEREYAELGWWTDAEKIKLADLSERHIQLLSELEVLGFESDATIFAGLKQIYLRLIDLAKDEVGNVSPDVMETLAKLIVPGAILNPSETNIIKDHTNTTEVDDILAQLGNYHKQYTIYIQLAKVYNDLIELQSQQASLFSDCWQEQLQYFIRLAQVFYCSEHADTNKPIWVNLNAIETEQDIGLIRWIFGELNAFWQGISDETREKMDKYSFTNPRSTVESPTVDSPAPQEPLPAGEQLENEPIPSIVATVTPIPLQTAISS